MGWPMVNEHHSEDTNCIPNKNNIVNKKTHSFSNIYKLMKMPLKSESSQLNYSSSWMFLIQVSQELYTEIPLIHTVVAKTFFPILLS